MLRKEFFFTVRYVSAFKFIIFINMMLSVFCCCATTCMNRNGRTESEKPIPGTTLDYDVDALAKALADRGHEVGIVEQTSGLSIIQVIEVNGERRYVGGADKRRDGAVGGDDARY